MSFCVELGLCAWLGFRCGLALNMGPKAGSKITPRRVAVGDPPDHGLPHAIKPLDSGLVRFGKIKFGACGSRSNPDRKPAAKVIFNESRFIPLSHHSPGISPQQCEIAELPFRGSRTRHQILRLVAAWVGNRIQHHPSYDMHSRRVRVIGDGVRRIELDEACKNPASDGCFLGGVRAFGGSRRNRAPRCR